MKDYIEFLKDKMAISHQTGFEVKADELTPYLYPHVKDTVWLHIQKNLHKRSEEHTSELQSR